MRGVTRRFNHVVAVDAVDISVAAGSIHALLGENGAGKTTLMRIAYGLVERDAGELRLFGETVAGGGAHSVRRAMRASIGMVHQHLSLVGNLSAAESLVLGGHGRHHPDAAAAHLARVSELSGLRVPHDVLVRNLSIVEQQRLEILKALSRGARLLILDEPTAVLAPPEIRDLLRWIRSFAEGGGSVVLITHKLREALAVADEVTVLRRGRVVHAGGGSARGASEADLARAIFPETLDPSPVPAPSAPGEVVARANALVIVDARGAPRIRDATFEVRRGEILGIAAIEGSGHRELLRALSAQQRITAGALDIPSDTSLIPADRLREALIPGFSVTENVALRQAGWRRGLMRWPTIAERARNLVRVFGITTTSVSAAARELSGGNQQRLVVARELEHDVALVVADNPTRGLDVQATAFVHAQLRGAAARGAAVVVHSSDLDEVLALATRVLVVFDGVAREVSGDRDAIGRAMLGGGGGAAA